MKGLVLDQLVQFIRERHDLAFAESLLASLALPSGGAFTSVGTYDASEMESIVAAYAERTGTPRAEALRAFGAWLFPRLAGRYAPVLGGVTGTFELLRVLDGVIHVEVRKLYPDAELPSFETVDRGPDALEVRYRSSRRLEDLAEGLMRGASAHFGERIDIARRDEGDATLFTLRR